MIPAPYQPGRPPQFQPFPTMTAPHAASKVSLPDPMAVHRDPSRRRLTGGTLASHARVTGDYQWTRLADLSVLGSQALVGRGISLERAVMRHAYAIPRTSVRAIRQHRAARTAPQATPSPSAATRSTSAVDL
ncbi:hypothetical protein ET495_08220 [Xylanimonas allomyrinae]|uniref:Uncharacterized protein n=1 Tax=Xylanimonas allomyrinae TaxID=2509459 RepID=A0A4V0YE75_9MICO|nr:hypothetical protein [Xylanimonas allomyrinae]QAY63231.1 hypothetical protein ET495_08220 [Xylanimonas allomyrinae]